MGSAQISRRLIGGLAKLLRACLARALPCFHITCSPHPFAVLRARLCFAGCSATAAAVGTVPSCLFFYCLSFFSHYTSFFP
ncbi:hypothetical protein BO78DRAFT_396127 [Aspergillus sclerotiicarbonarius CBS 121057]|uniref:Uncharacterized protein n=1 Tax=Aspergillus sclerotiicarbonarius (strain CBS 121057 / IBT 28362) TaxID=1448318 RepID=A0A319EDX9_ASPSB|nr:hypothetical protein BO78DRAFT_396127 [Aspergillus sclerotiicarbonarius CBS 121057]